VFGPAIFIGAALGGMLGFAAPFLDYQICVLVGMGALVSSVIGAPLATILIVFELTENYQATTAVMMGVVAANAVVTRYYARSIFHRQVLRWGIDLERPKEQRLMSERRVEEVMSRQFLAVEPERSAAEVRALVGRSGAGDVFVVAGDDLRLEGKVPLTTLVAAGDARSAGELCEPVDHMLLASDDLWTGLLGIEHFVGYSVPVVADRESRKLVGVVTESDFISAYRKSVREIREDLEDS
jgi:CIC family chloride channel protein